MTTKIAKTVTDKDCLLMAEGALRAHNFLRAANEAERAQIAADYRQRAAAQRAKAAELRAHPLAGPALLQSALDCEAGANHLDLHADAWERCDDGTWAETAASLQARIDFYRKRVADSEAAQSVAA